MLDLLDHIPKESPSNPGASLMVNHGYALPSASPLQSATPEFEAEARRIAAELECLRKDAAIAEKSTEDPDASFYANLIRDFGASYTGKGCNVPAISKPEASPPGPYVPTKAQRVQISAGLSQEQRVRFFQKDLGQALQYGPTPEEIAALPKTVIDLTGTLKPPTPPDGNQADSKAAPIREWNVKQAPPGLCPACWWRWSRALQIGCCVCSGDVKLTLLHRTQTHELRTEIGGDDNPAT